MKERQGTLRAAGFTASRRGRQRGAALVVALLMLIAVAMLGTSAAQVALQEEKASRAERDRQVAMQSAQAALSEAERDIEKSARSHLFAPDKADGFEVADAKVDLYRGLWRRADPGQVPIWQTVDFMSDAESVPYGTFTGQQFQTGSGLRPTRLPSYIIELMSHDEEGAPVPGTTYFYRITAVGFGLKEATQAALQSYYRKAGGSNPSSVPAGRFSWREITNWKELRDALAKK